MMEVDNWYEDQDEEEEFTYGIEENCWEEWDEEEKEKRRELYYHVYMNDHSAAQEAELIQTHDEQPLNEVFEELREQESRRPPKINNVKKPPQFQIKVATLDGWLNHSTPTFEYVPSYTPPKSALVAPPVADTGDLPDLVPEFGTKVSLSQSNCCAEINYFNERMAQWCMEEPPIPLQDFIRIQQTFTQAQGTTDAFDPFLPHSEVRRLVILSKLDTKRYVEKWLSIRYRLGAPIHPVPSGALKRELRSYFGTHLEIWRKYPRIRGKRKSMPNYNFNICQYLLLSGKENYILYSPWFPVPDQSKCADLHQWWASCCIIAGWPILTARWTDEGLIVETQKKIK